MREPDAVAAAMEKRRFIQGTPVENTWLPRAARPPPPPGGSALYPRAAEPEVDGRVGGVPVLPGHSTQRDEGAAAAAASWAPDGSVLLPPTAGPGLEAEADGSDAGLLLGVQSKKERFLDMKQASC